jgi:hypothetical protein
MLTVEINHKVYLIENPQGKHGRHRYTLKEFGLAEDQVLQEFEHYNKKYIKSTL